MSIENKIQLLKASVKDDQLLLDKLSPFENFYKSFGQFEHFFISKKLLEKNIVLKSQLLEKPDNLLLNFSTLRFILESLIHSKLFIIEERYIYTFFYSIYNEQIIKIENFISRLEYEIKLIENYNIEEIEKTSKKGLKGKNKKEIIESLAALKIIENEIDNRAEKELTIFWGDFKNMGYFTQKYLMENDFMEKYKSQLYHLNSLKTQKQTELLKNEKLKLLFEFNNEAEIFIKIKEKRRKKMNDLLEGEKTKVGINKYFNAKEDLPLNGFVFEEKEWELSPCFESMLVENSLIQKP